MDLHGVIPPLVTPVDGGDVAVDAIRSYGRFLIDGGVHGLFTCGSTGEFTSLTREQRRAVVETVVEVADDTPVLAGCGGTSLPDVVAMTEDAAEAEADAAVVVTPYYFGSSQRGLREFFRSVAEESPLPVVLYEIPSLVGQRLSVETIATLSEHDNVVGIKDSTANLTRLVDVRRETAAEFRVLQGASELAVATLDAGCDGLVAGPANVFPTATVELYDAHRRDERDRAVSICNDVVTPTVSATSDVALPAAMKYLLSLRSFEMGRPLPPIATLPESDRETLRERFEAIEASAAALGVGS